MGEPEELLRDLAREPALDPFRGLVEPLENYDRERRGDLIRTLQVFFESNSNVSRAAERLYLHRNSLIYRLNRIEDLTGLELKNPRVGLALRLGLLAKEKGDEDDEAEHAQPSARDHSGCGKGRGGGEGDTSGRG
jgi:DNA-binding PucR family transcriptional regulator